MEAGKPRRKSERLSQELHLIRIECALKAMEPTPGSDSIASVRFTPADFSLGGVGLFSNVPLETGQLVQVVLGEAKDLVLSGRVVWCHRANLSKYIIKENSHAYRAGVNFIVENPQQQDGIRKFYEALLLACGKEAQGVSERAGN